MLSRNPYAKGKQSESLTEPKSKRREAQGSKAAPVGKNKSSAPKRNDVLHAEVLALGGNDDDYKMISGLESDSEVEGDNELADVSALKMSDERRRRADLQDCSGSVGEGSGSVREEAEHTVSATT